MLSAYILVFPRVQVHYGRGLALSETFTRIRKGRTVTSWEQHLLNLVQKEANWATVYLSSTAFT